MTQDEFSQWVKYHSTVVASFGDWLRKLPPIERQEMLVAWFESSTLDMLTLESAKQGTRCLLALPKRPFHFDQHPQEVARLAVEYELERQRTEAPVSRGPVFTSDGDRTYRCRFCQDSRGGWVHTVRPELVAWFERTFGDPPYPSNWRREWLQEHPRPTLDGTLLCPCRHPGKREVVYERTHETVAVFNADVDCLWSYPIEEAVATFVRSRIPVFAEGYFDD